MLVHTGISLARELLAWLRNMEVRKSTNAVQYRYARQSLEVDFPYIQTGGFLSLKRRSMHVMPALYISTLGNLVSCLVRKFQEAKDFGITVQFRFDDMCSLLLTQTEICALFSNILDNAIEANQALAEEKGRWIKLDCVRKGRILVISESNPMQEGKVRFMERIPQTTKKDKRNHGLGMQSIKRVVELYGGHMQIGIKEGVFQVVICLEGFQ